MDAQREEIRLDKWLWAARFFKTRSLATEAVNGGRVHLNDNRVKASRSVGAGDKLEINKGGVVFKITIIGVNKTRRPAKEATLLYEESEESISKRELDRDMRRMANAGQKMPAGKPSKRDRRKIKEFIRNS